MPRSQQRCLGVLGSVPGSTQTISPRTRKASLRVTVTRGPLPRLRHKDKGPLHHTRTGELRPGRTGMAEPLRASVFHIADVVGRSATIATPRPQRTIRRAGVGPEQERDDPGSRMGIDFGRLPPREGKAAPGFLWREVKQWTSRRWPSPVISVHNTAFLAPVQKR